MARCWSQRPAAHSSRRCRRCGCSTESWLLVGCPQGRVQQPQRSGWVRYTSAKARARPRVVVAVHEYLEQNTAVGAVVALSTPSTPTCSWMMWHFVSLPLTMSMTPETPIVLYGAPEDVLMSYRSEGRKIVHNQRNPSIYFF